MSEKKPTELHVWNEAGSCALCKIARTAENEKAECLVGKERLARRCGEAYEKLIGPLREVARQHGYAIGVHGSLARDIDLIACRWRDFASQPVCLAEAIRAKAEEICGYAELGAHERQWFFVAGCPGSKPHGRLVWSIHLGGGPYIDLSVMPGADKS